MRTIATQPTTSDDTAGRRRTVTVGALLWVAIVQYFVVLAVVQSRWTTPYSSIRNAISDLGAVSCFHSDSAEVWVCSPWHLLANISWFGTGICLALGAPLLASAFPASRITRIGLWLYVAAGLGLMIVAANPEDVRVGLHQVGALVAIIGGEAAMIALGIGLLRVRQLRVLGLLGVVVGTVAVVGLVATLARVGGPAYFGLWERISAFPVLIYAIGCGLWLLLGKNRTS